MSAYLRFSCAAAWWLAAGLVVAAVIPEGDVQFGGATLVVADQQDGSLTVTPPDAVIYDQLIVGNQPGAFGEVLLDGAAFTNQFETMIGYEGVGEMTLTGGGRYEQATGYATIGASGLGTLTVEGVGSLADFLPEQNNLQLSIGGDSFRGSGNSFGRGEVTIRQGAELHARVASLGGDGSASLLIEGQGSLWRSADQLSFGNADVTIRDGGRLLQLGINRRAEMVLGQEGVTTMLISGQGSLLNAQESMTLGYQGQATVRVDQGADVVVQGITTVGGYVGGPAMNRGVLELAGFGTTWTTDGLVLGGQFGQAEVLISEGAILNDLGFFGDGPSIGEGQASTARIWIDGPGSTWSTVNDNLYVGQGGDGELRITGGAYHQNEFVFLGQDGWPGKGDVFVSGSNSRWQVTGDMRIVRGRLTVENGGAVQLPFSTEVREQGGIALSDGRLLGRLGDSSINNRGVIRGSGVIDAAVTNEGRIEVGPGQRLEIGGLTNNPQSEVEVEGGELSILRNLFLAGRLDLTSATLSMTNSDESQVAIINDGSLRVLGGENRVEGFFLNRGSILATGDSTTQFFDGFNNRQGELIVTEGSEIVFFDTFSYTVDGGVQGDGLARFEGGLEMPLSLGQASAFEADLEFAITATTQLVLGDQGVSAIETLGAIDLGGELSVDAVLPQVAPGLYEYTILSGESLTDEYDSLPAEGANLGSRTLFRGVEYRDASVVLLVEQLADGDYNADGVVDQLDQQAWADSYGQTGDALLADGNGDGRVDAVDYSVWRDALAETPPPGEPVPEPASLLLLAAAVAATRRP